MSVKISNNKLYKTLLKRNMRRDIKNRDTLKRRKILKLLRRRRYMFKRRNEIHDKFIDKSIN